MHTTNRKKAKESIVASQKHLNLKCGGRLGLCQKQGIKAALQSGGTLADICLYLLPAG